MSFNYEDKETDSLAAATVEISVATVEISTVEI